MTNYWRAIRLCFGFRWTLGAALLCSVLVGITWGANIGALLPLVRVIFHGDSVLVALDKEIAGCRANIAEIEGKLAALQANRVTRANAAEESRLVDRRQAEAYALAGRLKLRPYVAGWLPTGAYQTLLVVVGVLIGLTMLKTLFFMGNTILVERAIRRAMMNVRQRYFAQTLQMDQGQLGNTSAGELTSQFAYDMNTLVLSLRFLLGKATVEPLKILACLVGASLISWRLLLVSVVVAPLAGLAIRKLSGSIKRANRRALEEMSHLVGSLVQSLQGVQTVKAFTMEEHEKSRFESRLTAFFRKSMRIAAYSSLIKPSIETTGIAVTCLALVAGGYLVLEQQTHLFGVRISNRPFSPEMMFGFFAMLIGMSDPARKLATAFKLVQPGIPAADRIFAVLDRPPTIQDPPSPQPVARPHRELAFDNVSFAYNEGSNILREISLTIPHGETLAIVGPNGCGKSTLANLVPRFYDPAAGSVRIDGVDLREMSLNDLRRRIALVSQQTLLFDDTIAGNIRYGSPDATDEQIHEAAKRADAHPFIMNQPAGYETAVGSRGGKLSGGQRQKIALARAILRDPDILILDEATSAVDIESEHNVHQVLKDFAVGRTALIITHRLSTLQIADRILVMNDGRIQDIGTHQELINRCPIYQRLHAGEFKKSA